VRRKPYAVVLFDEIEKAHPDVMHLLLQILEEGKITDSLGRKIDFRNTIIIMTSNVGAELIKKQTTLGFGAPTGGTDNYDVMKEKILGEAKRVFKPEFINRLDDIIVFHTLEKPDLVKIVDLEISKVVERVLCGRPLERANQKRNGRWLTPSFLNLVTAFKREGRSKL